MAPRRIFRVAVVLVEERGIESDRPQMVLKDVGPAPNREGVTMREDSHSRTWEMNPARAARSALFLCLAALGVILVLDVGQHLAEIWYCEHIKDLSNVLLENSVGTWFSVVLNAGVGLAALGVALVCRRAGKARSTTLAWSVIGLFFLYVSLDDHLVLHERLAGGIGRVMLTYRASESYPFLTYEWIYFFAPLFALFGLFMLVFLFRQQTGLWNRFLLVLAFGLWAVAVGLDAWEGAGLPYEGVQQSLGWSRLKFRHGVMLVEEMMELLGSILFLYLFFRRLGDLLTERPTTLRFMP